MNDNLGGTDSSSSSDSDGPPHKRQRFDSNDEEVNSDFNGTVNSGLDHLCHILVHLHTGDRDAFFTEAFLMMSERLHYTSTNKPGSASFQTIKERAALTVLAVLGGGSEYTYDWMAEEDIDLASNPSQSQQSQPPVILDDDDTDGYDDNNAGVHVLLSNMLQVVTTSLQPSLKMIETALVTSIRASPKLLKQVRMINQSDPKFFAVQRAFALLRLKLGNYTYNAERTGLGRLGKALDELDLCALNCNLMPVITSEQDAAQFLSDLEQEVFENVQSGEKSIQPGIPAEVYVSGLGWRSGLVKNVDRDADGEIETIDATVWPSGLEHSEDMFDLERKSVVITQLLPQKLDQGSCAWITPEFMMKVVESLDLFNGRTGNRRVVSDQYDGSGLIRSEKYNHNDVTLKGKQFYGGRYTDGSIYHFIIGMLCTNKDTRMLFDAWICEQEERWNELFALEKYKEIVRIAIYDLKAMWDATRGTPITHTLSSCDDPLNNAMKRMGQMYDPENMRMICVCVPNKTIESIANVMEHAASATKYFNVNGEWALSCRPSHTFHDPLHYGRWCCQVLGNILLGALAAGGEALMFLMMDHIQQCCGVELHNHHGIQVSAVGRVTVTTRKGVGAVMRVCAHYNLVFNMRCECCQIEWPEEYKYILEALNIYMLVVQMIVVPWLRYDMDLQQEYVKEVIVLVDIKRIIECEIIGPWIDKISGRLVASGAERLARILTEKEIHLASVNAKPVETMHVPVAKYIHKSGGKFGGQRDVVHSRRKGATAVLCSCLLGGIQGQPRQEEREKRKKKKELKKNKEFFEPLMLRNKHFIDTIIHGGSMFHINTWQFGQNLVSNDLYDGEAASDADEEKSGTCS